MVGARETVQDQMAYVLLQQKLSSGPYSKFYFSILTLTSETEKSGQVKKSEVPKSATNKNVFGKREFCGDCSCMNNAMTKAPQHQDKNKAMYKRNLKQATYSPRLLRSSA